MILVFESARLLLTRIHQAPDCPADYESLWSGYSLVFFEGNGYGLSQDLGSAGK